MNIYQIRARDRYGNVSIMDEVYSYDVALHTLGILNAQYTVDYMYIHRAHI